MKFTQKLILSALLSVGLFLTSQTTRARQASPAAPANYADEVVATVGKRTITRRDVTVTYVAYNPKIIGEAALERYPQLNGVITLDMDLLCRAAFQAGTAPLENVVERLLEMNALEEAAERREIKVTLAEVNGQVHTELEARRKGQQIAAASDEELAQKLGDRLFLLRGAAREGILRKRLMTRDLEDRLGHPLGKDDYYSVRAIFTRVNDGQGLFDAKASLEKIRSQREAILAKKRTFEEAARTESLDASKKRGGSFGPLPRKLLKNEIDSAVSRLKPGEITEPLPILEGYVIFQLEKSGRDLTDAERQTALATYFKSERTAQNAIARMVKDILWSTTIGKTPEWMKLSDEADSAPVDPKPKQAASDKR